MRPAFIVSVIVCLFGFTSIVKAIEPTAEQRAKALAVFATKPAIKSVCNCTGPNNCTCSPGTCKCPQCVIPAKKTPTETWGTHFIEVRCSPTASIMIDGKCTTLTGSVRRFEAPTAGTYTIQCCDGNKCQQRRVSTGTTVDFGGYSTEAPIQFAPMPPPMPMPMMMGGFAGGFGGGCAGGG